MTRGGFFKPNSLRETLTAAVPAIAREPDRLEIFIDEGKLVARGAKTHGKALLGFSTRYTLTLQLLDFAEPPDAVFVPVLLWVTRQQPDLLLNPENSEAGIRFTADDLGGGKVDLNIELELSERVGVRPRPPVNGRPDGFDVIHYPEPIIEGAEGVRSWELFLRDELIAKFDAPADAPLPVDDRPPL